VPILHAVVLGIVQGLSEFLPISSSGHLLLVPWLFGWDDLESASVKKAFDVALHLGTLIAVLGYFRHDVVNYVREGVLLVVRRQRPVTEDGRIAWLLVLATIPAAAVGATLEEFIDEQLGTPLIIAISLIVFGLALGWADRSAGRRPVGEFRTRDALIVGAAQALALNPGTSRSGITMTAARRRGFSRDAAARLSFLMSLPVTGGAVVFKMTGLFIDGVPEDLVIPMIVGIVTSGVAGWLAVWGTLKWVRSHSFAPFVVYRVVLGLAMLAILAAGWR
jgi:undecaprenyl-diphosphatase